MRGATILFAIVWPATAAAQGTLPAVWVLDSIAHEDDGVAGFTVVFSREPDDDVRIHWRAESLTASAADLAALEGDLVIPGRNPPPSSPSTLAVRLEVPLVTADDTDENREGSETFLLRLAASNATVVDDLAHGVIRDGQPPPVRCDVNDDGHSDVLLHVPIGPDPTPHRGVNHDTWAPVSTVIESIATFPVTHWRIEAAGDFDFGDDATCDYLWGLYDHDGKPIDLAITEHSVAPESEEHGEPVLHLQRPVKEWQIVGAADLTGNPAADVLWWDPVGRRLHVSTELSTWGFERVISVAGCTEEGWEPAGVARISRDAMPDILGYAGKDLVYRTLTRDGPVPICGDRGALPDAYAKRLAAVGDFDADGTEDLILDNRSGGSGLPGPQVCFIADRAARTCSGLQVGGADLTWWDYGFGWIAGPR